MEVTLHCSGTDL